MGNQKGTGVRTRAPRARARVVSFVKPQFLDHEADALGKLIEDAFTRLDKAEGVTLADYASLESVRAELARAITDAQQGRR